MKTVPRAVGAVSSPAPVESVDRALVVGFGMCAGAFAFVAPLEVGCALVAVLLPMAMRSFERASAHAPSSAARRRRYALALLALAAAAVFIGNISSRSISPARCMRRSAPSSGLSWRSTYSSNVSPMSISVLPGGTENGGESPARCQLISG